MPIEVLLAANSHLRKRAIYTREAALHLGHLTCPPANELPLFAIEGYTAHRTCSSREISTAPPFRTCVYFLCPFATQSNIS